jgi:hypothetical protein
MIYRHQERGLLRSCVLAAINYRSDSKSFGFFARHWNTHRATTDSQHEINLLRSNRICGANEVPLVFTVFIVYHDDHLAVSECFECSFNGIQRHWITSILE